MKTSTQIAGIIFFGVLLFWGIISSRVLAQKPYDYSADSIFRPKIIKTNPVRMILDEMQIFYEVPKTRFKSIEWKMGIIHPGPPMGFAANPGGCTCFHHWGLLGGMGYRWYSNVQKPSNPFLQVSGTIKLKYMPRQIFCGGGYCQKSYPRYWMDQQLYTMNFQVKRGNIWYQHSSKLTHEIYYGIGFNISYVRSRYYGCYTPGSAAANEPIDPYESIQGFEETKPRNDQGWYIFPTLHVGYKIGWQLKKKSK